jgi:hypothetical protein
MVVIPKPANPTTAGLPFISPLAIDTSTLLLNESTEKLEERFACKELWKDEAHGKAPDGKGET